MSEASVYNLSLALDFLNPITTRWEYGQRLAFHQWSAVDGETLERAPSDWGEYRRPNHRHATREIHHAGNLIGTWRALRDDRTLDVIGEWEYQ